MKSLGAFAVFLLSFTFNFLLSITSILLLDHQLASFLNIRLDIGGALLRTTVSATSGNDDRVVVI